MEIKKGIKEILVDIKPGAVEKLDGSRLVSDGVLDSLDIMNLIMALEQGFDIEIDPEDVLSNNFESVDAIAALINKCRG